MPDVRAYVVPRAGAPLEPATIHRRDLGPHDVNIAIGFSGICHSDLSQAHEEWFTSIFPMVPGHEIAGHVIEVGSDVTRFAVGDRVGVGCYIDSCRVCENCLNGLPNYCLTQISMTYNGREQDGVTPTLGGYAGSIVVDEAYVLGLPAEIPLHEAAPLLCAGITTYQPLAEWGAGPGTRVGVVGLGGLGHMAIRLGKAMGAHVTVISQSSSKEDSARELGADSFVLSSDASQMEAARETLDLVISTASGVTNLDPYLQLLRTDGTLVSTGLPDAPLSATAFLLTRRRRRIAGVSNGSIAQTQEMLDLCGRTRVGSIVEVVDIADVNEAWSRLAAGDIRYRFVLDTRGLAG